jgi:hypothetical protein
LEPSKALRHTAPLAAPTFLPDGQLVLSLLDVLSRLVTTTIGNVPFISSGVHGDRTTSRLRRPTSSRFDMLAAQTRAASADRRRIPCSGPARPLVETLELLNERGAPRRRT